MINKNISHYKIIEELGRGGMGEVYLAEDLKLKRKVAIKFLPQHLTKDKENVERFEWEAKAAASLNHPNIVTIYEIAEENDQIFIVMEYVEGISLRDVINESSQFPIPNSLNILTQICEGLSQAHQAGIVHRDLKPENIIIAKDDRVKILDFGLAKLKGVSKLTKDSSTLGTVHYMSPEQIQSQDVDHRSDIWTVGVVLFEMLSRDVPFKGDYSEAVHYAILNEEPKELPPNVTETQRNVVNKCLFKNPDDRYGDLKDIVNDFMNIEKSSDINKKSFQKRLMFITILIFLVAVILVEYLISPLNDFKKSDTGKLKWENSIAVLPFEDMSPDNDQEWFCAGMTEQVISNLSRLPNLKVTGRQSVMKYKNSDKTIPEIGRELNVTHVLESSIRKSGNQVRVTSQLIKTEDGFHLWSQDFDRTLNDIFDIQDDISENIATDLLTTLSPEQKEEIKTNRPSSTEAYEYYMRGRYFHLNKFWYSENTEDFITSEKMFKKAIKLDPNYADSYASLADLYNTYYNAHDTVSEKGKYMQLQEAYLDTAYNIDPNSAEVNYAKGYIHLSKNEDDEAFRSFITAIKISPNNDHYFRGMGIFFFQKGCAYLSIKCLSRAIELNPLDQDYYLFRGRNYANIGEFSKAESDLKTAIEINPHWFNLGYYIFLLVELKRYDEAKNLFTQLKNGNPSEELSFIKAIRYAIDGKEEEAIKTLHSKEGIYSIVLHAILGKKDKTLNILEKATEIYQEKNRSYYLLLTNLSIFDHLRTDSRFQKILAKHKDIYEKNLEKYGDLDI
jgi:serine/threonine protein kinase